MDKTITQALLNPQNIQHLLEKHSDTVQWLLTQVKNRIKTMQDTKLDNAATQAPLDDLFVLRFILSNPTNKQDALEKCWKTMVWRAQHLDELIPAAVGETKLKAEMSKYSKHAFLGYLQGLHPMFLVRAGYSDPKGMFETFSPEEILHQSILGNEYHFRLCDTRTRETGILCKQIAIVDLEGFSISKNFDRRFITMIAKSSHLSSTMYPQLLGRSIFLNMPFTLRVIIQGLRMIMPKSSVEKQAICPAVTKTGSASDCPFLKKFQGSVEMMPPFLGGTASVVDDLKVEDGN